jgi:hypothetical protein
MDGSKLEGGRRGEAMTETRTVRCPELVYDPRFQPRQEMDEGLIETYREAYRSGVSFDAITAFILDEDEAQHLRVVDGWHRGRMYEREGVAEVEVRVLRGALREAEDCAWEANLKHGKQLTLADRERRARLIFARESTDGEGPSLRTLAKDLGVSHMAVQRWRTKWSNGKDAGRQVPEVRPDPVTEVTPEPEPARNAYGLPEGVTPSVGATRRDVQVIQFGFTGQQEAQGAQRPLTEDEADEATRPWQILNLPVQPLCPDVTTLDIRAAFEALAEWAESIAASGQPMSLENVRRLAQAHRHLAVTIRLEWKSEGEQVPVPEVGATVLWCRRNGTCEPVLIKKIVSRSTGRIAVEQFPENGGSYTELNPKTAKSTVGWWFGEVTG